MSSINGAPAPLVCPVCDRSHPAGERFCTRCGMPLVERGAPVVEEAASEAHERARKIHPELARGPLLRVAGGRNQAEAELIQGLLLEEGVPSMLRRTAGFDVPDFLAAGPRDVLVPESGVEVARGTLLDAGLLEAGAPAPATSARQTVVVTAAITGGAGLVAAAAWLLAGGAG
ncbi:MAG TPA: hypothetical protein VGR10_07120 [Thermoleophilaceae bacterium]|nr:hypothetical protein [Thermoleophilaceae bacterium]